MAVEAFLPGGGAKHTIEKAVREKPTREQLTKIESPGRPMPASRIAKKRKTAPKKRTTKKTTTRKRATAEPKISKAKRDATLIITEKPQAAQKIADALGAPRKLTDNKVSYYELTRDDKKIIVASAVGHLYNLTYAEGQKGYPIFRTEWVPSHTRKGASFTKAYFNTLKKLAKRSKEVIVATDYDIEGEVIGWNVLRFIVQETDAKRMKYSTLTKDELRTSYENLMSTLDWGQAYAGETRHKIDWLYGINLSRALMSAIKKTDAFRILSIGRVQGPALKIIVDRDREIAKFKPVPYWQVFAHANNIAFKHPKDIFDKNELEPFIGITQAEATTTKKEESLMPPHPFDLTTLQREAHRYHRISPSNTLKAAQALYLDGVISYPRTSSQKIPKEIKPKEILRKLEKHFPTAKQATRGYPVEGKKSDPAHPSIYPTGDFKKLDGDKAMIYDLIAKRFIACFSPDAKTATKKVELDAKGKKFVAKGLTVLEKGWTNTYPASLEEKEIPDMEGTVPVEKIETPQKETQPPKRFTAASLVSILERKNLGTKATRSSIVDTLFDRGYLDGKSIQATPLGVKLIEALEKYSPIIIDENLTRDLEEKMEAILVAKEKHTDMEQETIQKVERLITDITKEFKSHELEIGKQLLAGTNKTREQQFEQNKVMDCPVCKKGTLCIKYSKKTRRSFVACDQYPECTATYSLPPNAVIKKTDKVNDEGLPILMALRKGKRPWEFPFDPHWKTKQHNQ